jgi:hypothetical protein
MSGVMHGAMRLLAIYSFMAWTGTVFFIIIITIILHGEFGALTFIAWSFW